MIEDQIFAEIQRAQSILLHLHPSPDCDSQGSALAMYHALTSIGKKVTVIKGDSDLDQNMAHLPGADKIVAKNFLEIDQKEFDLFIVLDSTLDRITSKGKFSFEPHLKVINIDHHASNKGGSAIDLIDPHASATAVMVYRLLKKWNIAVDNAIARNLLLGIYTDTGNFVHATTNKEAFVTAMELRDLAPEFAQDISALHRMDFDVLRFESLAYRKAEKIGDVIISFISLEDMQKEGIDPKAASASLISGILRNVNGVSLAGCGVEDTPHEIKCSFRSQDIQKYDLSVMIPQLGGGGHKAAAGALIRGSVVEARERVLSVINQYTK